MIGTNLEPPKNDNAFGSTIFVETVMKCRNTKSYNNTAEHTHLQCIDSTHRSDRSFKDILGNGSVSCDLPADFQHTVNGNMHNKVCDQC